MSASSTHVRIGPRPPVARIIRDVWRQPLYRSGHALVANSVLTSGVGVAYWVAAARLYPTATVGKNSAAISAMMFLAVAAQLNLKSALVRFVPVAGTRVFSLVAGAYVFGGLLAGAATLMFLGGLTLWAPDLTFLSATPLIVAWFAASSAVWSVFIMQESALTGLGRAVAVPIQNLVFSLAKLGLIVVFAALLPLYGILASWTLAMAVVAAGTSLYVFARVIPMVRAAPVPDGESISPRRLVHYMSGDYVGSLMNHAAVWLLPIVVLAVAGARDAAVFTLAWNVAYTLYLVPSGMGQSLVAHTAGDQPSLESNRRAVLRHTYRLLLPASGLLIVAAPWVLRVFGAHYSDQGGTLLRLLALSALPGAVTALAVSEARVRRRMRVVVAVYGGTSGLVLAISLILLPLAGITGVGAAWLAAQTIVAATLLMKPGTAGRVSTRFLSSPIGGARVAASVAARLRRFPRDGWRGIVTRHVLRQFRASNPRTQVSGGLRSARVLRTLPSVSDTPAAVIGADGHPTAVLKIAARPSSAEMLHRQVKTLATLRADDRLGEWRTLLPHVIVHETARGHPYVIETKLPADDARTLLRNPGRRQLLLIQAANTVAELHRRTASPLRVDEELLSRWVDEPARSLHHALRGRRSPGLAEAVDGLTAKLRNELAGRRFAVSWVHGDYCPGNILAPQDGSRIIGIVDWAQASPRGLPALDIATLLLATEMHTRRRELGTAVRARLEDRPWSRTEQDLLQAAAEGLPGEPLNGTTLLLLSWLRHVGGNLAKSGSYGANPIWMRANVVRVLWTVAHE